MRAFLALMVGVLIGFCIFWYLGQRSPASASARTREAAGSGVAETNKPHADSSKFDVDSIKEELARTGRVIRDKAREAGKAIRDSAADASITAKIKTKLIRDTALAAFSIDVNTTDGVVTLAGSVSSYEQVATAMRLAMETDGVEKVISTLQVKESKPEPAPAAQ